MRGFLNRLCFGFAAVFVWACSACVVRADSAPLTLDNFTPVTLNGRAFPFSLGNQPWLTATFAAVPNEADEAMLTLTAGNWSPDPAPVIPNNPNDNNMTTGGTLFLSRWAFNSSIAITGISSQSGDNGYSGDAISSPFNVGTQAGTDSAGDFSFALNWAAPVLNSHGMITTPGFTDGTTQTFILDLSGAYSPAAFDQETPKPPAPGSGLFQAYTEAIISGTSGGEDYVAVVPEPSRLAGLLGMSIMGGIGLCFGYARKRKAVIC